MHVPTMIKRLTLVGFIGAVAAAGLAGGFVDTLDRRVNAESIDLHSPPSPDRPIPATTDLGDIALLRRVDADDDAHLVLDDDDGDDATGDGDRTAGNDGTSGGNNTGDGDRTAGNDGTGGGNNTGDGSNRGTSIG